MESLINILRTLQADAFVFYSKAHGYHWNVEGMLFNQFHEMFSDLYNELWSSVDQYAEWVRIFGEYAEFNVVSALETSNIKYDLGTTNSPQQMLQSLLISNAIMIQDLKSAFVIADEANEQGVADYIAGQISSHEKWRWKISSTLKIIGG